MEQNTILSSSLDLYTGSRNPRLQHFSSEAEIAIDPKIEVQNIVASSDLEQEINLNTVAITLGLEKVEYEPEQFPGLVYRLDSPKVVVLLFGSGKMVCTGAKVPEDVVRAVQKIAAELRSASLMS